MRCKTEGCSDPARAKGWCTRCYQADRRGGKPGPRIHGAVEDGVVVGVSIPSWIVQAIDQRASVGGRSKWLREAISEKLARDLKSHPHMRAHQ